MDRYNPLQIEQKWQKIWEETEAFKTGPIDDGRPKKYLAEMFPYPSGAGLHVGHVRNFTIVDVLTRFYTQQELNVLRPFGYDTFGLPAENYAIKTGISPQSATATNIANFRKQAKNWVTPLIGAEKLIPLIQNTIVGRSGASCSYTRQVWLIRKNLISGGVQ